MLQHAMSYFNLHLKTKKTCYATASNANEFNCYTEHLSKQVGNLLFSFYWHPWYPWLRGMKTFKINPLFIAVA